MANIDFDGRGPIFCAAAPIREGGVVAMRLRLRVRSRVLQFRLMTPIHRVGCASTPGVPMALSGIGAAVAPSIYTLTHNLASSVAVPVDAANNLALSAAGLVVSDSISAYIRPAASAATAGNAIAATGTYSNPALSLPSDPYGSAWATAPTDAISQQMEANWDAHSQSGDLSALLGGLGTQLLSGFATTQSDFQQTLVEYPAPTATASDATTINATASAAALKTAADASPNDISLKIYTVSGKEVDISIGFGGNGGSIQDSLSVNVHTSGTLSAAEQTAIANLSSGFEAALQGITSTTPQVDLAGLINFDPTVLSGVDLNVRELPQTSALQSLSFHADASGRSFAMQSQAGSVSASVDLSDPALWGSKDQRQAAVQSYLAQFDTANQRAHGGATLLRQFEDAFSELNSSYPASGAQYANAITASQLNTQDRSVLTGLADFKASMSGAFNNGSPSRGTTEAGQLDYSVSQNTATRGFSKNLGLTVVQTRAATLAATYDTSPKGELLDTSGGNYDIHTINDSSSTTAAFSYADNLVKSADITTLVNQSMLYEKLVNHEVVEKTNTPYNLSTTQDISAQLRPPV